MNSGGKNMLNILDMMFVKFVETWRWGIISKHDSLINLYALIAPLDISYTSSSI